MSRIKIEICCDCCESEFLLTYEEDMVGDEAAYCPFCGEDITVDVDDEEEADDE